jgi:nucleotide-binding universal stress UspA family protein
MRILLAIDGSESSKAATRVLSERPWPKGSTVRVLSVVQNVYPIMPEMALVNLEELSRQLDQEAEKLVAGAAESLRGSDLTIEQGVRHGDPRSEIVNDAKEWRADLVVLGSHGLTGFMRWVIGSVAEHVVRHAPCSVEVARLPSNGTSKKTS